MCFLKIYGNPEILSKHSIAIYCSRELPLAIYGNARNLFQEMTKENIAIAGGWQSPLEKHLLKKFPVDAQADLIFFLAKTYSQFRLPRYLNHLFNSNKIAIVEPLLKNKRITKTGVEKRDFLIEKLIDSFLFLYIKESGRAEKLLYRCITNKKNILILNHPLNQKYFIEDIQRVDAKNIREVLYAEPQR